MKSTFSILFYLKRNERKSNGNAPIMGRITINGKIAQFSAKINVNPDIWDVKAGKAVGRVKEVSEVNSVLDSIKATLTKIYRDLQERESNITPEKIKNIFFGIETNAHTLLQLFTKHNEDFKKLIGISRSSSTLQKYTKTQQRLKEFLKDEYNLSDIALKEINHMFVRDFAIYLETVCKYPYNGVQKFMQRFKSIILLAQNNGWIFTNPFANYKIRFKPVDKGYLSEEELETIIRKKFDIPRLEQVRDVFIFSCFTGLAYIDVKNLREENIRTSFDEKLWIMTKREKTNIQANIQLLDIPKTLLDKYKGICKDGLLLPILSNQKMNAYLKEIGDVCGIDKKLSYHLARHTFATTVTLAKGVPIETVSKMLGHTSIKTTQIYARIINSKISEDMNILSNSGKLDGFERTFYGHAEKKHAELKQSSEKIAIEEFDIETELVYKKGNFNEISQEAFETMLMGGFEIKYESPTIKLASNSNMLIIASPFFGEILGGIYTLNGQSRFFNEFHYGIMKIENLENLNVHLFPKMSKRAIAANQ